MITHRTPKPKKIVLLAYTSDGLSLLSAPSGITVLVRDYTVEEPGARAHKDAEGFEYVETRVIKSGVGF